MNSVTKSNRKIVWLIVLIVAVFVFGTQSDTAFAIPAPPFKICGTVFYDRNQNGIFDGNDLIAANKKIAAHNMNVGFRHTMTDASGRYCVRFYPITYISQQMTVYVGWYNSYPAPAEYTASITVSPGELAEVNIPMRVKKVDRPPRESPLQ